MVIKSCSRKSLGNEAGIDWSAIQALDSKQQPTFSIINNGFDVGGKLLSMLEVLKHIYVVGWHLRPEPRLEKKL